MKVWQKNVILLALVVLIAMIPLWLLQGAEFGGADGAAMDLVTQADPGYEVWFEPVLEPASGEVESMLFAAQAAVGSGVVCFILGRMTARKPEDGGVNDGN